MPNRNLVLIPGLLSDSAVWADMIGALPSSTVAWVADHGLHNSVSIMAQSALQHAPCDRFWLAGHSMGGRVALEMYRQAPERIRGVALLSTGWQPVPNGDAGDAERRQRHALLDNARRAGMRHAGECSARPMVHPQQLDTPMYETLLQMVQRKTPDEFAAQVHALLSRPDATGVLGSIGCPALVLVGRQDGWSPVAQHEALAQMIPTGRLRIIEGAGHMLPMEQPVATAAAIAQWMLETTGGPN